MDQRLSFVTLAVADLAASRHFYLDGLGWRAALDVPGEVLMIRTGEQLVLSLWDVTHFEGEVGAIHRGPGVAPLALAHNVADEEQVDAILDLARASGATEVAEAQRRDWGGYSGYFADPDGFRWEIAVNPGPLGQAILPPHCRDEVRRSDFGQPIGPAVIDWVAPPRPDIDIITGSYCRLEALAARHAAELRRELGAPEHASLWTYLDPDLVSQELSFDDYIERRLASDTVEVVITDASGVACGLASLMRVDVANGCVEVGSIIFGPRLQRTTAATEAISLLAGHIFALGYRRLEWKCDSLNEPSRRAAGRLGFTYEGTFRRNVVVKGRSRDTAWFSITSDDWPRIAQAHRQWLSEANFADGVQLRSLVDLLAEA